jgi:tRNA synthetases class I (E and Q), anti-codon binding domain.
MEAVMLKPVGLTIEERKIFIEKRILGEKADSIIQLYRLGFARVDSISENKVILIFAHE